VVPAVADFLTSIALIMAGEAGVRAVMTRMEDRIEDWKAGRFPTPDGLSPIINFDKKKGQELFLEYNGLGGLALFKNLIISYPILHSLGRRAM
jgi:hypothetical protein